MRMTMDLDRMLSHVRSGHALSTSEIENLCHELQHPTADSDLYTVIHILGKANVRVVATIIEGYLAHKSEDPEDAEMVRRIAMQVLGRMWSLATAFPAA